MPTSAIPNLLFVFADQMRGMDMGPGGNPQVHTPTMDRLAREGVRMTHAFATTPVCGPNRAVLLTGTYPLTNRVPGNDLPLPTDLPSLGRLARSAGYRTGYIGKWHLDGVPRHKFTPPGPRRHGFDFWAAYNCTHDYFHPKYFRDAPDLIETPGYEPVVQADLALEFLDAHTPPQPFCLLLSWGPPHDPYHAVPEAYRARYDPQALTLRPNAQPDIANPLAAGKECRRTLANYYAAITALDDQLARLLDRLQQRGLADNTLVVFTSDHGDMLWSHGWMKKQAPYEESIHVPLLLRWPGHLRPNTTCDTLCGTVDLLPTLLTLLGLDHPATLEGADLTPHLPLSEGKREQGTGNREDEGSAISVGRQSKIENRKSKIDPSLPSSLLLGNYLSHDEAIHQNMPEWRALRTPSHTYVEKVGRVPWLLFDNAADPYQLQNLVTCSAHQPLLERCRQQLTDWLTRTHDPFLAGPDLLAHLNLTAAWQHRESAFHPPPNPTESG